MPWTPPGLIVRIEGRGEFFVRHHRHDDADRPTVLLLHGWTASSDLQFVTAYRALCAEYHVVGVDHRGHGRGLRSPERFELEDVADDAAAVCRTLGVDRVIAVGYSMGGPLTLLLTRRHPELVAGIVVQATALEWRATAWDRAKWRLLAVAGPWLRSRGHRWYLNRTVPRLFHIDSEWRPYAPWLVSEMARNDPYAVVEAGRALSRYDARPWAADLDVPAGALDHDPRPPRAPVPPAGAGGHAPGDGAGAPRRPPGHAHGLRRVHPPDDGAGRGRRSEGGGVLVVAHRLGRALSVEAVEPAGQPLERARHRRQLVAQLLARQAVRQHQPHAGDLAGEELGVGLRPFGDLAVELGLDVVPTLLAVLGQEDQRGGVGGLGREGQVEEDEGIGVPLQRDEERR